MERFAVLQQGFEQLSYALGKCEPENGLSFSEGQDLFRLHKVQSEVQAEMAIAASGFLSQHASLPAGYLSDEKGEVYLVCRPGRPRAAAKKEAALAMVLRLAELHTQGFGCGGLDASEAGFSQGAALLSDPSRIFALSDSDSLFCEAVSTLRSIVSAGFAGRGELPSLARAYLSASPVCRHAVRSHMDGKGVKGSAAGYLAKMAEKYANYF